MKHTCTSQPTFTNIRNYSRSWFSVAGIFEMHKILAANDNSIRFSVYVLYILSYLQMPTNNAILPFESRLGEYRCKTIIETLYHTLKWFVTSRLTMNKPIIMCLFHLIFKQLVNAIQTVHINQKFNMNVAEICIFASQCLSSNG